MTSVVISVKSHYNFGLQTGLKTSAAVTVFFLRYKEVFV